MLFILIPCLATGAISKFGIDIFKNIGPFYTFCLICAGIMNFVVDMVFHAEIKKATKKFLFEKASSAHNITTVYASN